MKKLTKRFGMARGIIKRMLRRNSDATKDIALRYSTLHWFVKKNCVFVNGATKSRTLPENWKTAPGFELEINGHRLILMLNENLIGRHCMVVNLLYSRPAQRGSSDTEIMRGVPVSFSKLPVKFRDPDNADEPNDVAVDFYNDLFYSYEIEFFHHI